MCIFFLIIVNVHSKSFGHWRVANGLSIHETEDFFFAWRSDMTPGLQLQQLLGEDAQIGEEPHIVFSEMQELRYEQGVLGEWKEKAR